MNATKLLADYLRGETGARVVAKTPDDTERSWIRLTPLAAPQAPNSRVYHLVAHYFQLDCYAGSEGGQPEAEAIRAAVVEAIEAIDQAEHELGEVTAGRIENGAFYNPDTDFRKARERFVVTATVWAHP